MNPFATQVYEVLEGYSVSPWSLLKTACGWTNANPFELEPTTFAPIIERLGSQIARMTDEDNARELVARLRGLI